MNSDSGSSIGPFSRFPSLRLITYVSDFSGYCFTEVLQGRKLPPDHCCTLLSLSLRLSFLLNPLLLTRTSKRSDGLEPNVIRQMAKETVNRPCSNLYLPVLQCQPNSHSPSRRGLKMKRHEFAHSRIPHGFALLHSGVEQVGHIPLKVSNGSKPVALPPAPRGPCYLP